MPAKKESSTHQEEFQLRGKDLLQKIKELLHEGNIRRIIVKDEQGSVMLEIPVTFAAVGVLLAPFLAAVGTLAALLTKCTIVVVRK